MTIQRREFLVGGAALSLAAAALPKTTLAQAAAVAAVLFGFIGIVETAYTLTGNVGPIGAVLAMLPGGRAGGLIASAVLFMAGRAATDRLNGHVNRAESAR